MACAPRSRVLALSLALNAVLVGAVGVRYAHRLMRPAAAPSYPLQRMRSNHLHELAQRPARAAEVVMLGDSLTQYAEWSELMGLPVANRGVAGDTVEQVQHRLDDVVALRPKLVVLLVGINDLVGGAAPPEVARRHAALVHRLKAALPTTRVVVQALLPVGRQRQLSLSKISETNALLARSAKTHGHTWLDAGAPMRDSSGHLDPRYSLDGLHLSGEGYRVWAEAIRPMLP